MSENTWNRLGKPFLSILLFGIVGALLTWLAFSSWQLGLHYGSVIGVGWFALSMADTAIEERRKLMT